MIVTVDDVGFHEAANRLVRRAVAAKIPTHVGIMTTMSGSAEALELVTSRSFQELQHGLHFNISEGCPASDPRSIPSLLDPSTGQFYPWPTVFQRSALGQTNPAHIAREAEAQLEELSQRTTVDFFNSHHHVHLWPPIARALAPVIRRAKIPHVRHPQRIWWRAVRERFGIKGLLVETVSQLSQPAVEPLTAEFVDFDWVDPSDSARLKAVQQIPARAELACHPHCYTTPSDPTATPNPVSSLEWLIEHGDQLPQ